MIHESRIILNRIQKLSNGSSVRILTIVGKLTNPDDNKTISCQQDYGNELSALIDGLIRDGYLVRLDEYRVVLTDKGLHPYKMKWEEIKAFLIKSIFVPIVVSIATSIAVLCMQGLL